MTWNREAHEPSSRTQSVLFCESSPNFGGQEQQILLQMAALEHDGCSCVLACRADSRIAAEAGRRGLRWKPVRFRNSFHPPSILAVRRLIRECHVGICHSGHDANTLAFAARMLAGRRARLLRVRTYLAAPPRPWTVNQAVDHTLTPSRFLRNQIVGSPGIRADKVSVLNPIVPAEDLRRHAKGALSADLEAWISTRNPLVVHAAMLRSEKGHAFALSVLARLVADFPKLGYVMAGVGKKEKALRERVSQLGLEEHVHFAGLLMPVAPLLARADLVVMPSRSEPLGLAQLEALALGVPVAVSEAGGLPETVQDGVTGWVLPTENPEAWIAGLREALANPAEARRRALVGQAQVEAGFSPKAHQLALQNFFSQGTASEQEIQTS